MTLIVCRPIVIKQQILGAMPDSQQKTARKVLARNLRRLRAERDLSQEVLADLAGLHRTYVSSVERSERNVSLDSIEKLARALRINIAELLRAEP